MPQNLGGKHCFSGSKAIVSSGQSYRFLPEKHCSLKTGGKTKCSKCLICKTFYRCILNAYTCNKICGKNKFPKNIRPFSLPSI